MRYKSENKTFNFIDSTTNPNNISKCCEDKDNIKIGFSFENGRRYTYKYCKECSRQMLGSRESFVQASTFRNK